MASHVAEVFERSRAVIRLHLQGKHAQQSHGRRGGGGQPAAAQVSGVATPPERRAAGGGATALRARGGRDDGGPRRPIPAPKDWPPAVERRIAAGEEEIRDNAYESLMIYDTNGRRLFTAKGERYAVTLPYEHFNKARDNIITHNHPVDLPPSGADIAMAMRLNAREMRAASAAHTYRMQRPKAGWPPPDQVLIRFYEHQERAINTNAEGWWQGVKTRHLVGANPDRLLDRDYLPVAQRVAAYSMERTMAEFQIPYVKVPRPARSRRVAASEAGGGLKFADPGRAVFDRDQRQFLRRVRAAMQRAMRRDLRREGKA
jgi:hypothetical protein